MKKTKGKKTQQASPTQARLSFKKHFMPPLMGLAAMLLVLAWFNSQLIASRIAAWRYEPPAATETKDRELTTTNPDPNTPASITISKISVRAPVIYGEKSVDETRFQKLLEDGVVHYPNTSLPGKSGNVVIFGHSSGQVWAPGNYKFVFTNLEKLVSGDKVFLDYQGVRYQYEVNQIKVVPPTEMSVLKQTTNPTLTLITCTPVGTNINRLIVTASQISPNPKQSTKSESADDLPADSNRALPGTTPSIWNTLRSIF